MKTDTVQEAPSQVKPSVINEALAKQIETVVLRHIAQDSLSLPSMPVVALKCLEVLQTPSFSFKEVATILEQDPVLAARTLRVATSAAFAGSNKTPTLHEAFARLGANSMKTLLIDAAASKLFVSRDPQIADATKRLWQHSVAVGLFARDVHAVTGGTQSDTAYIAGLLHDIGKPIVAAILLEAERNISDLKTKHSKSWISSGEWLAVVKRTHRTVGLALTEKWKLPPVVCQCIKDCSEYDPSDRPAISNAVCFANALTKQIGLAPDDADIDDAKALVMIGRSVLGLDDAVVESMVAAIKPKLAQIYD